MEAGGRGSSRRKTRSALVTSVVGCFGCGCWGEITLGTSVIGCSEVRRFVLLLELRGKRVFEGSEVIDVAVGVEGDAAVIVASVMVDSIPGIGRGSVDRGSARRLSWSTDGGSSVDARQRKSVIMVDAWVGS